MQYPSNSPRESCCSGLSSTGSHGCKECSGYGCRKMLNIKQKLPGRSQSPGNCGHGCGQKKQKEQTVIRMLSVPPQDIHPF
ncbi:hypothetical protein AOLI_G00184290 [Acnodon oligacanthus]